MDPAQLLAAHPGNSDSCWRELKSKADACHSAGRQACKQPAPEARGQDPALLHLAFTPEMDPLGL